MLGKVMWKTGTNLPKLALAAMAGGIAWSRLGVDHEMALSPCLVGDAVSVGDGSGGSLRLYREIGPQGSTPVLLVHSVNAAASAYEMKPLFDGLEADHSVYALDLPGYGHSTRGDRSYSPQLMAGGIESAIDEIGEPVHLVAMSLGSEFAARVAARSPDKVKSLSLISPTGFGNVRNAQPGPAAMLKFPVWAQAIFDGIVSRPSIRYFLDKSFTSPVDEALIDHAYRSAHQPGARHAPLAFLSGELFSRDAVDLLYQQVTVPTVVLYDRDAYSSFIRLPDFMSTHGETWSAVRINGTLGMPHWDEPGATMTALREHWDKSS